MLLRTVSPASANEWEAPLIPLTLIYLTLTLIGGGFGGKETRTVFISCAVAVAAAKTQRPVHVFLPRDVDMAISGDPCHFLSSQETLEQPTPNPRLNVKFFDLRRATSVPL